MSITDSQVKPKGRTGKVPFEIIANEDAKPPVLALRGDVDVAVSEKLHDHLNRLVEAGYHEINIDCAGVTYFDSTGLSELVWAVRRMPEQGKVRLTGCSPRLVKLLTVTGLDNIFELDLSNAA